MVVKPTDKILLARPNFEADEANDACDYGKCSHSEGQSNCSGCLEDSLDEEGRREHVDGQIASQAEREVEDERLLSIEHRTCTFFLRPLHRDVFAAEEGVVEETRQIADNDEGSHEQQEFLHRSVTVEVEEGLVESQHAKLRQAQSEIIKIVRGEGDL